MSSKTEKLRKRKLLYINEFRGRSNLYALGMSMIRLRNLKLQCLRKWFFKIQLVSYKCFISKGSFI